MIIGWLVGCCKLRSILSLFLSFFSSNGGWVGGFAVCGAFLSSVSFDWICRCSFVCQGGMGVGAGEYLSLFLSFLFVFGCSYFCRFSYLLSFMSSGPVVVCRW